MRRALVKMHNTEAGYLTENDNSTYLFTYFGGYNGSAISLTMPIRKESYLFNSFPSFFDGVLPEGIQLEGLLKSRKIDKRDYFSQLVATGEDLIGALTVHALPDDE